MPQTQVWGSWGHQEGAPHPVLARGCRRGLLQEVGLFWVPKDKLQAARKQAVGIMGKGWSAGRQGGKQRQGHSGDGSRMAGPVGEGS